VRNGFVDGGRRFRLLHGVVCVGLGRRATLPSPSQVIVTFFKLVRSQKVVNFLTDF
jgi:hypothetical protein